MFSSFHGSNNIQQIVNSATEVWKSSLKKGVFLFELLFYVHGKQLWSCRDSQLT